MLLPLIEKMKDIDGLKIEYLVADLGYFDADDQVCRVSISRNM